MKTNVSVHDLDAVLKQRALDVADEGIIITDLRQPDGPVIFANQGFVRLTGSSGGTAGSCKGPGPIPPPPQKSGKLSSSADPASSRSSITGGTGRRSGTGCPSRRCTTRRAR
jgi:hypothetical protein